MRLFRYLIVGLLITATPQFLSANTPFDFNSNCIRAYNEILKLKLDEGASILKKEKDNNPDNLIPVLLEDYIDFLKIFISEDQDLYNKLKSNRDKRLNILKKNGDEGDPYYLFCIAEIHLHWFVAKVKMGDYFSALLDIRKAFKLLEKNRAQHADFMANLKSLGMLHAVLGSLPDKYKWSLNILGLQGNVKQGMSELEKLVSYSRNNDFIFDQETKILYAFLLFHLEKKGEEAWQLLIDNNFPSEDNLLHFYACAQIGIHSGKVDSSIQLLNNKPGGPEYLDFPYLDFLSGLARLYKLDKSADVYFKRFLENSNSTHHIKDAYQKLAWHYFLQNDTSAYHDYMDKVLIHGSSIIDADKQALLEAEEDIVPNGKLLMARLLFDGGLYEQAVAVLEKINPQSLSLREKVELSYRFARVFHEWDKIDKCLKYYNEAITMGLEFPYYYAANSALQLAYIYEEMNELETALLYYDLCLSMKNHEYKNSLDQKAKAGINRIENNK